MTPRARAQAFRAEHITLADGSEAARQVAPANTVGRSPWIIPMLGAAGAGAGFALGSLTGFFVYTLSVASECRSSARCPEFWHANDYIGTSAIVGSLVGVAGGLTLGVVLVATAPA